MNSFILQRYEYYVIYKRIYCCFNSFITQKSVQTTIFPPKDSHIWVVCGVFFTVFCHQCPIRLFQYYECFDNTINSRYKSTSLFYNTINFTMQNTTFLQKKVKFLFFLKGFFV